MNEPSPHSGGAPLPPRHRPNLDELAQGTTEADLWDLSDADLALPEDATQPGNTVVRSLPKLPLPRQPKTFKTGPVSSTQVQKPPPPVELERPLMQVGKVRSGTGSGVPTVTASPVDETFAELGSWDDIQVPQRDRAEVEDAPPSPREAAVDAVQIASRTPSQGAAPEPAAAAAAETAAGSAKPLVGALAAAAPSKPAAVIDEFSPREVAGARPFSFRPQVPFSWVEILSIAACVLLLLGLGMLAYRHSIHMLASENQLVESGDFPMGGRHLTAEAVTTYWRAPILEGEGRDNCRRGTLLLPVIELRVSGGPAAIRVFFRNADGELVGDAVTRAITPGGTVVVPATAGFEDSGMYAAYRTGSVRPWTVEVHEAPGADAAKEAFTKWFVMNLSASRR